MLVLEDRSNANFQSNKLKEFSKALNVKVALCS